MACLERRLQARHLRARTGRLEAHDQRVLRVLHVGHDALQPALGRGIVLVFVVGLVARPVAALEVEDEARRLVAALIGPAEVDAVEVGGVAVAEPHGERVTAVDLGVLAVELAADLREAVGGDELVAEALALLLVAGDALGELQAHVLKLHEVLDPGRAVEGGAAAIAHLGQVGALLQVRIAALRAALHRGRRRGRGWPRCRRTRSRD